LRIQNCVTLSTDLDDNSVVIVNFPFISSDIPVYAVYISQLIRYGIVCAQFSDILDRSQLLTQKLPTHGYVTPSSSLQTLYSRHHDLVAHYEISLSQRTINFFPFYVDCFVSSITDKIFIGLDYIRVTRRVSYKKQERLTLRENMGSPPVIGGVSVPHLFIILCWVVFLCFICLHPVSYVPNVASFSGLFILTLPLRFSLTFIVPVLF
jgi:hypothetical protein